MAHLKKSSTTGHLLKSSRGHLVNGCQEPVLLMPCYPIFVLEPCGGGAPICCRNDFREFLFLPEADGHLWAQDVLIVQGGQCYRVRYCEDADGCGTPNVETGLKVWAPDFGHFSQEPAGHTPHAGECDSMPGYYGPDCDYCPPKWAFAWHTCSGPGHGACSFSYATQNGQFGVEVEYGGVTLFAAYGQDTSQNFGICPIAGPPPGGCDDFTLGVTWEDADLDDWVEPLNRPAGQKPTPPDCWYIFDGQTPYDRHVGIHGCILERRVAAGIGEIITLTEPANAGDLVPCYMVDSNVDNPDAVEATVYRHLQSCEDCCS